MDYMGLYLPGKKSLYKFNPALPSKEDAEAAGLLLDSAMQCQFRVTLELVMSWSCGFAQWLVQTCCICPRSSAERRRSRSRCKVVRQPAPYEVKARHRSS